MELILLDYFCKNIYHIAYIFNNLLNTADMASQKQLFGHIWKGLLAVSQLSQEQYRGAIEDLCVSHFTYVDINLTIYILSMLTPIYSVGHFRGSGSDRLDRIDPGSWIENPC